MGISVWGWPTKTRKWYSHKVLTDAEKQQILLEVSDRMLSLAASEYALASALGEASYLIKLRNDLKTCKPSDKQRIIEHIERSEVKKQEYITRYREERKKSKGA